MSGRAFTQPRLWALVLLAGLTGRAWAAEVEIDLPLQGLYHAGRYMPVRVIADAGDAGARTLTLGGREIVPTEIQLSEGRASAVVPLLVWGASPQLWWRIDDGPPVTPQLDRPLIDVGADTKLMAMFGDSFDFTSQQVVPAVLDPLRGLSGDLAAWETIDGLVLESEEFHKLPLNALPQLVAIGTAIYVRSEAKPDSSWDWRRWKEYWVLDLPPAGPRGAISAAAYLPVGSWSPGRSAAFRQQVLLAGVLFSILVLGATLLSGRRALIAVMTVCAVGFIGVVVWARAAGGPYRAVGGVATVTGRFTQLDRWQYFSPGDRRAIEVPWRQLTKPAFADPSHATSANVTLVVNWNGEPIGFRIAAPPGGRQAMLTRGYSLPPDLIQGGAVAPAMLPLLREAYLRPDLEIVGHVEHIPQSGATDWGIVRVDRVY